MELIVEKGTELIEKYCDNRYINVMETRMICKWKSLVNGVDVNEIYLDFLSFPLFLECHLFNTSYSSLHFTHRLF